MKRFLLLTNIREPASCAGRLPRYHVAALVRFFDAVDQQDREEDHQHQTAHATSRHNHDFDGRELNVFLHTLCIRFLRIINYNSHRRFHKHSF